MANPGSFEIDGRNRVRRLPRRGHYDRATVYSILDQAWMCHVGIVDAGQQVVIPMMHARLEDQIILHGARSSRLLQNLGSGQPVCVSAAIVDGLVLAKSLFHHSMNYRSVVAFGHGETITDQDRVLAGLKALSDKVLPGRWDDARQPTANELKATTLIGIQMESASAKIRSGGPIEEEEDHNFPCWSGVVPMQTIAHSPVADSQFSAGIQVPEYLANWKESLNHGSAMHPKSLKELP